MKCRKNCGACCIAPSISSSIPGMPNGKPAGVRCIHLQNDYSCGIYKKRPKVCRDFKAEAEFCGSDRLEAMAILSNLEQESQG